MVNIRNEGDGLLGSLRYNAALYEENTVSDLVDHFLLVLGAVAERPQLELQALTARVETAGRKKQEERVNAFRKARLETRQRFKKKSSKGGER